MFKIGDLIIVTPDAVNGVIEVKKHLDSTKLKEASDKLGETAEVIYNYKERMKKYKKEILRTSTRNKTPFDPREEVFVGIIGIEESNIGNDTIEMHLKNAAKGERKKVVNHLAIDQKRFVKFFDSTWPSEAGWHIYEFPDSLAHCYFISNALFYLNYSSVFNNKSVWFPYSSKNPYLKKEFLLKK